MKLLHNAHFYIDGGFNNIFTSLLIDGDRIVNIPSNPLPGFPDLERIDLKGAYVYPGFIDAHTHSFSGGLYQDGVDLSACSSLDEILNLLSEAAKQGGTARNNTHYGSLESQNIEGLITHRMKYTEERIKAFGYKKMFDAAFPEMPIEQRYSNEAASFALSAYLRALLTNQAPFQKWLKGDKNAMTEQQKSGAIVFFGKAGCVRCHSEPNLGSINFAAVGVKDLFENGGLKTDINDLRNKGRGGFTNKAEDFYKFRVPQLYNLGDGGPYFHGSSKQTLKEVVEYFNDAVPENGRVPASQLSPFFKPLNLSEVEKEQLVAFLKDGLRDANLKRYVPERVNSGMCFPNNDYQSKEDMGCH